MTPGPAAAAEWVINSLPRNQPPLDPERLLIEIGNGLGWFTSPEDGQEKAEAWRDRFLSRLRLNINDPQRPGRPSRFEFNGINEDLVQGSCFVEADNSPELAVSKKRRENTDQYVEFSRTLSGRQFEGVCRGILVLMGCEDPTLTPRGNDQGIDFHGRMEMRGRLSFTYVQTAIDMAMRTWILGQAKQASGKISTPEIRDFIGSAEIARLKVSADGGRALSGLHRAPWSSTMLMFITTGDFTRDSLKLIRELGIVAVDGETVASLLADHEVAVKEGACQRQLFDEWVAEHLAA